MPSFSAAWACTLLHSFNALLISFSSICSSVFCRGAPVWMNLSISSSSSLSERYFGRSSRPITPVEFNTTALSIIFSSSLIFPGQLYPKSFSIARGVKPSIFLLFFSAKSFRKCCASTGISSLLSRNGGTFKATTLSR